MAKDPLENKMQFLNESRTQFGFTDSTPQVANNAVGQMGNFINSIGYGLMIFLIGFVLVWFVQSQRIQGTSYQQPEQPTQAR